MRVSSYLMEFAAIIIFMIYFYNHFMHGFLDYLPEYLDYAILILFSILWFKFLIDIGNTIS